MQNQVVSHEEWLKARLNGAYHYLDFVPKGRDEDGLKFTMEWVRRHDQH
jgi:predicted dithiol-disulfide oxidoreductase (DUF899 family)